MASSVFDRKTKDANAYATDAPWVEKFRPKTLDEVAAHKEIIETSEVFGQCKVCQSATG